MTANLSQDDSKALRHRFAHGRSDSVIEEADREPEHPLDLNNPNI
jgi:hypothetical protein